MEKSSDKLAAPLWWIAVILWIMLLRQCAGSGIFNTPTSDRGTITHPIYVEIKSDSYSPIHVKVDD